MDVRRIWARALVGLAALLALSTAPAWAEPVNTGHVVGELHSSRVAVAPGERFTILLSQQIAEGWHTYWRNPGDSGEATSLTWTTPPGFTMGDIQWPTPSLAPTASIVNFGYHGEVLYPIEVTVPANAPVGRSVTFSADAFWLVCADICIPEQGTLTLSVPVAAQGSDDPVWAARAQQAIAALPRPDPGVRAAVTAGTPVRLSIAIPNLGDIRNPHFFTYNRDLMAHSAAQHPRTGSAGLSFDIPSSGVESDLGRAPLEGVVTFEQQSGEQWTQRVIEIAAAPGATLANTTTRAAAFSEDFPLYDLESEGAGAAAPATGEAMTPVALLLTLGFALLGGLILNIMPCVLPVLSVKALQFAGGAHSGEARRHGVFYLIGVLATFMALAGLLIAFRAGGEAVGWGFQLQAPWVISALALLFFVIGLNLLGMFEIGGSLQNAGAGLATRGGDAGAFFTGALAVIAATPCTAPFMAGAIGAVLTQSAGVTLLIFFALALGFAAPLVALHFAPGLQKLIPKPGPWMERVKNLLAFPMFAAAVWLAWVLTEQAGSAGTIALLTLCVAVTAFILFARWGRIWLVLGVLQLAITGAFVWKPLVGIETQAALASEPWSAERVAALQAEGRPIFVDFTAAWCVTCKVNEAGALSSRRIAQAFSDRNVAYLVGDWTNKDEAIAAALAEHGRAGVPLYLYYPAGGGPPQVLPQILTEGLILDVIAGGTQ